MEDSHWALKTQCFHFWPSAVCEFGTIPFNPTRSCLSWDRSSCWREMAWWCWTWQRVCLPRIFGLLVNCQHRVGFHVWSQEKTYSLMLYIFAAWYTSWKSVRLQQSPDLFPRKDCLHEILLEMNAMSEAHRGQDGSHLTSKSSPPQAPVDWALSSACPKKIFQQQGTVTRLVSAFENQRPISGNDLLFVWKQVWGLLSCSAEGMESSMISHQTAGSGVSLQ